MLVNVLWCLINFQDVYFLGSTSSASGSESTASQHDDVKTSHDEPNKEVGSQSSVPTTPLEQLSQPKESAPSTSSEQLQSEPDSAEPSGN